MISDTEIYKNTYAQLVVWIKELIRLRRDDAMVYDRNINQARRIMELEFDLRRYSAMMIYDRQEDVVKEYGTVESNVVTNEELTQQRLKLKRGGGGNNGSVNYLIDMEWGTQFYVRPKGSRSWMLVKFLLAGRKKDIYLLVPMKGDENEISDDREWLPVESKAFTTYWELVEEFPPPKEIHE